MTAPKITRAELARRHRQRLDAELSAIRDWEDGIDNSARFAADSRLYYAYLDKQSAMNRFSVDRCSDHRNLVETR